MARRRRLVTERACRPPRPLLVVDNITKRFETPDGVLTAVDDMSFDGARRANSSP